MSYKNLNSLIKKFMIVVFLYALTSSSFNGFYGIYIKELGYTESFVGTILSLRRLSVGVSTFLIALIAGKIGHKKTLILGLLVVGFSSISIVIVKNTYLMKVIVVIYGFGQAAMLTVESLFIYNQTKLEERVHAFSLTFATRNAAYVAGSILTGFLADYFAKHFDSGAISIRYALVLVSVMSIFAILPLIMLKPKPIKKYKKLDLKDFKGFFNKTNIIFLSYTGFIGLGAGLVVPFFGVYLKYMLNSSESITGLILSFAQFGAVLGGLSVPLLSKKAGKYRIIVATQILSIPLLISIGFPQGIVIVAISFFLRSSLMNINQPLIRNISMDIAKAYHRPFMSAMRVMVNNLMRSLGIFMGGSLMETFTYNTPYFFASMFYIIATFIFFKLFKDKILVKAL